MLRIFLLLSLLLPLTACSWDGFNTAKKETEEAVENLKNEATEVKENVETKIEEIDTAMDSILNAIDSVNNATEDLKTAVGQ